jgi:hypothetical protein
MAACFVRFEIRELRSSSAMLSGRGVCVLVDAVERRDALEWLLLESVLGVINPLPQ